MSLHTHTHTPSYIYSIEVNTTLSLTSSRATSLHWIQFNAQRRLIPVLMWPRGRSWLPSTVQRHASEVNWHLQTVSTCEGKRWWLLDPWRSGDSPRTGWPTRQLVYAAGCCNLQCNVAMNSGMINVRDLWCVKARLQLFMASILSLTGQSKACIDDVWMLSRHPAVQRLDLKWLKQKERTLSERMIKMLPVKQLCSCFNSKTW